MQLSSPLISYIRHLKMKNIRNGQPGPLKSIGFAFLRKCEQSGKNGI